MPPYSLEYYNRVFIAKSILSQTGEKPSDARKLKSTRLCACRFEIDDADGGLSPVCAIILLRSSHRAF